MSLKTLTWVSSFSMIFFFLPSLLLKLWDYLIYAPWSYKSWLIYLFLGVTAIVLLRYRSQSSKAGNLKNQHDDTQGILHLAKERLAKGEITLEEYREMKREIN